MCFYGVGTGKDVPEALNLLRQAAEQDDAEAQYQLGVLSELRCCDIPNFLNDGHWWFKARRQGHIRADYDFELLSSLWHDGLYSKEGVDSLFDWCRQGFSAAQYVVGTFYTRGWYVEQDLAKAEELYRKAAEQGDFQAQYNLGLAYWKGDGVEQDCGEAEKWFRKAAEQGHDRAQYYLGYLYENGYAVGLDIPEAAAWYRKAAAQGHSAARERLEALGED